MIGTRFDRNWVKYCFVTLDITIISVLIATQPMFSTAADLPAVTSFRGSTFVFYFIVLGVAALSFSPGMVAWTGVAGALGWLLAFMYSSAQCARCTGLERHPQQSDEPTGARRAP